MWAFFVAVCLLNNAVQYARCERFIIIPSPDSLCPGDLTGESCFTLQQYIANPSRNSSVTLELHPGNHRLESRLLVSNINSFIMVASAAATTSVSCGQSSYFSFSRLQHTYISDIIFVGCRMDLNYIANATAVRSLFINMTRCCNTILTIQQSAVQIKWCAIKNNQTYRNRAISISNGNVSISSSNFSGCAVTRSYGGAISISRGNVTITNSYFSNNMVIGQGYGGGAVSVYDSGLGVTIVNTYFSNNTATGSGGAVCVSRGELTLVNTYFKSNRASVNDNDYGGAGGAIYISTGGMNITNSYFRDNAAEGSHGGAIYVQSERGVTITNSYFIGNLAEGRGWCGGVVFIENGIDGGGLNLFRSHFCDNIAGGSGGAIYISRGVLTAVNSYFSDNMSGRGYGGAAIRVHSGGVSILDSYFSDNTTGTSGGARYIYANGGDITVINTTFMNAVNNDGGRAVYYGRNTGSVSLTGNTFSSNTATYCGDVDEDEYFTENTSYNGAHGQITEEMTAVEDGIMITTTWPDPFAPNDSEVIANKTNTEVTLTTDLEPLPEMQTTIVSTDSLTKINTVDEESSIVITTAFIVSSANIATTIPAANERVSTTAVPTTEPHESSTFIPITTVPITSSVLSITLFEASLMGVVLLLTLLITMIMLLLCISYIKKCSHKMKNGAEATGGDSHSWPLEMKVNEAYTMWGQGDSSNNIYEVIQ